MCYVLDGRLVVDVLVVILIACGCDFAITLVLVLIVLIVICLFVTVCWLDLVSMVVWLGCLVGVVCFKIYFCDYLVVVGDLLFIGAV